MNYQLLGEQVKQYSLAFFNAPEHQYLAYHDLAHTNGVVQAAVQIGSHYQLSDEDFFVVTTAAWFHDMGYFSEDPANHEQVGAKNAAEFLKERNVDESIITQVQRCILATKLPQSPVTLPEQIVCDADLFHLGTDEFPERNKLMRKECETCLHTKLDKEAWRVSSIKLLQSHHYHTEYCKLLLNNKKQENLNRLLEKQQRVAEEKIENPPAENEPLVTKEKKNKKNKKNKGEEKNDRPDKGIETMFRVASTNHQRLSDMSDNKAHIMISVNSIIISVIIGLVVRKLDATPNILIPTLILLTGSVTAIVFAVLATRPKIPDGTFTRAQVDNKTVNLLF